MLRKKYEKKMRTSIPEHRKSAALTFDFSKKIIYKKNKMAAEILTNA